MIETFTGNSNEEFSRFRPRKIIDGRDNKMEAVVVIAQQYGNRYKNEMLKEANEDKDVISNDCYKSIEFLFSRIFYRGRHDKLSEKFKNKALKVIREFCGEEKVFVPDGLEDLLKKEGVNNRVDRRMVFEVLKFISNSLKNYQSNIVKYTIELIEAGRIKEVFRVLNNIYGIGDKTASFYLRDVIIVYGLERKLTLEDFQHCQPIDTWIRQVTVKLGIIGESWDVSRDLYKIKSAIIKKCQMNNVSPLLFNAGAWMVGAKALELLLEKIKGL